MRFYSLLLFLHVSGAICLFIGMGTWLFGSIALARAARVEQVRAIADLMLMARLLVPAGAFVVIAAGLAMTLMVWGIQTGWIAVALGSLIIIGPIGTWVIDPKVRAITALAQSLPDGALSIALAEHARDTVLHVTMHTLVAMLFGIVFLMTTKPTFAHGLGAIVISASLGLASGVTFVVTRQRSSKAHFQQYDGEAR